MEGEYSGPSLVWGNSLQLKPRFSARSASVLVAWHELQESRSLGNWNLLYFAVLFPWETPCERPCAPPLSPRHDCKRRLASLATGRKGLGVSLPCPSAGNCYNMLSVSLDEALALRQDGRLAKASLAVCVTPDLCNRFAHPLVALALVTQRTCQTFRHRSQRRPARPCQFPGYPGPACSASQQLVLPCTALRTLSVSL